MNLEINMLKEIEIEKSWSFSEKTIKDTSYITHGYYTYPAKFIPQLAQRLIIENSNNGDIIIDPFSGSGTTVLESIVNHRIGKGTDINEIATLIAKVKTTPINLIQLTKEYTNLYYDLTNRLNGQYEFYLKQALEKIPQNERIDFWFKKETKNKLAILLIKILETENVDIRDFFLVSFAQILKTCSIWMQKSVKPTRDLKKKDYNPITTFFEQTKKMIKKHTEFDKILTNEVKQNINNYREIKCQDARNLPCENEKATLIITSPPYVTSYEYADLHQLPLLWFGYLKELSEFRKKFMGSAYKERENIDLQSEIAQKIVNDLGNNKKGKEVKNYYADMLETWIESKRVLKEGGKACVVIGNTQFNGVEILNAEVFKQQFENIGFKTHKIIHREIPSKMLPSTRDSETGRFAKTANTDKLAYPTEYILIMEKL